MVKFGEKDYEDNWIIEYGEQTNTRTKKIKKELLKQIVLSSLTKEV